MRFLLSICFFLAFTAPALADSTPEQQQAVSAVENYLDSLTTLRAHFVQTANDGKQLTGTFYLKRPGRMRIDYDPPTADFIVADGLLIYYYDDQMKQQSNAPISKSLADFFLRKNLKLAGDISVSDFKRDKGALQMTLVQTNNPLAGSLTLILSANPLQLKEWEVVDGQGLVTHVTLTDMETGIDLPGKLFHYYDPARQAPVYNQK